MNALHPTESARDGKTIEQSHYIKKSEKLDRIIQCAQCGYMVNLDKRSTGPSMGAIPEGSATAQTQTFTVARGAAFTDVFADPVDTGSGCPFCNSMSPTASERGRTGFDRPRNSIENL